MLYTVCGIAVISFALIGMIDVYKTLSLIICSPKINNSLILLPIGEKTESTEFIIRCAITKVRWLNICKNQKIVCLNCGMNDESLKVCEKLCEKYPFVSIMTLDELKKNLNDSNAP